MSELEMVLVDEASFEEIPEPAAPGARCQTCDYWERLEGDRAAPASDAPDASARAVLKRERLLAGERLAGSYGLLAYRTDAAQRTAVGYAQFGPISHYPRAQMIRDRYPQLPESPVPWVITCVQVARGLTDSAERERIGIDLLEAVADELDRRGIAAVEAYPEASGDAWVPPPGPAAVYEGAGFQRVAGEDRYPVYRRELAGEADEATWERLLRAGRPPGEGEDWPPPQTPADDDFFKLPADRPKRPNPFGED